MLIVSILYLGCYTIVEPFLAQLSQLFQAEKIFPEKALSRAV